MAQYGIGQPVRRVGDRRTNPLGLKGAGEAGAIGASPALVNAVVDALDELGIEHLDMPMTRETLWRRIREATTRQAA